MCLRSGGHIVAGRLVQKLAGEQCYVIKFFTLLKSHVAKQKNIQVLQLLNFLTSKCVGLNFCSRVFLIRVSLAPPPADDDIVFEAVVARNRGSTKAVGILVRAINLHKLVFKSSRRDLLCCGFTFLKLYF